VLVQLRVKGRTLGRNGPSPSLEQPAKTLAPIKRRPRRGPQEKANAIGRGEDCRYRVPDAIGIARCHVVLGAASPRTERLGTYSRPEQPGTFDEKR
jgi:hypothetical protein